MAWEVSWMKEIWKEGRCNNKCKNVEDGALALCNVNEEQVQTGVEVEETFAKDVITIEVNLQKTIEMIMEQKH